MAAKSAARAIVIRQPAAKAPVIRVAAPRAPAHRRAAHHAKRIARHVGSKALEEKHTVAAVGAGLALGFIEREKIALPAIPKLGMSGTYGIGFWIAGKYLRSRTLSHMATGLLSIAAYQLGKTGEIAGDEGGRFPL
jgi:hypothetical protein